MFDGFFSLIGLHLLLITVSSLGSSCSDDLKRFDHSQHTPHSYPLVVAVLSGEDDQGYKPDWIYRKSYRGRRRAIRKTWKVQASKANIPLFFVLSDFNLTGKDSLDAETNEDVLLVPDPKGKMWGYQGLSAKMIFIMQFIARQCAKTKYLLKCDDDSYVHIPRLLLFLSALPGRAEYIGKRICGVPLDLQVPYGGWNISIFLDGKWAIPDYRKNTGLSTFPCYMQGGGYILSGDVVRALAYTTRVVGVQLYGGMEDMAMGLWLSGWKLNSIDLVQHSMFIDFDGDPSTRRWIASSLCKNRWLIAHRLSCGSMPSLYTTACPSSKMAWQRAQHSVDSLRKRLPSLLKQFEAPS